MQTFEQKVILVFCTALGVILGASLASSLAALVLGQPPGATMLRVAREIRIWAVLAAIGGTLSTVDLLDALVAQRQFVTVVKHLFYVLSAFTGAQCGTWLIYCLLGGKG